MTLSKRVLVCLLAGCMLFVVGCGDDDDGAAGPTTGPTTAPTTESTTAATEAPTTEAPTTPAPTAAPPTDPAATVGEGCWVHLFEEDDFDEDDDDDHFRLREPGRYGNLDRLPGASDDWTDEAESIRVGPDATVTIWPETDFRGAPMTLGPGSERADLDEEPESLELSC